MFKQMDLKGRVSKPSAGGKPAKALNTIHQNTINCIRNFDQGRYPLQELMVKLLSSMYRDKNSLYSSTFV